MKDQHPKPPSLKTLGAVRSASAAPGARKARLSFFVR